MDVKPALKSQYHAALAMLRDCIEVCPTELWTAGDGPRSFWRITYHVLFFGHLYLMPGEAEFVAWELNRDENENLWAEPWETGCGPVPYTPAELLSYCSWCDGIVDSAVDALDLDSPTCGFPWYSMSKFEHQLVNLRHLNQHVGQLSELLFGVGVDSKWVGGTKRP